MAKISINRALKELKTIGNRINKATGQGKFAGYSSKLTVEGNYKTTEEMVDHIKSSYQSVTALINRRNVIKSRISKSNALTEVSVNGKVMTVAEALEYKNGLAFEANLANKLFADAEQAYRMADRLNRDLEPRLDTYLQYTLSPDYKKKSTDNDIKATIEAFYKQNGYKPVDPIECFKEADRLLKKIEDFRNEVDITLNESNNVTLIEVPE